MQKGNLFFLAFQSESNLFKVTEIFGAMSMNILSLKKIINLILSNFPESVV